MLKTILDLDQKSKRSSTPKDIDTTVQVLEPLIEIPGESKG